MQSQSFGDFQIGIVDNPSIEDQGGFEFASGMDIFSEPGVLKANYAMTPVSGISPTNYGFALRTVYDSGTLRGYMAVHDKIYTSTDGITWSLFITSGQGRIVNLQIFNGYIFYAHDSNTNLGRVQVNNAGTQNDSWGTLTSNFWHPMEPQGGTLKIGNGRYVTSIDESFTVTSQAMKAPVSYLLWTMANYQNRLFIGSMISNDGTGYPNIGDATTFAWAGTVLSSGAALPDYTYHSSKRGMNLLISTGQGLFGFPDKKGEIFIFNGVGFVPFRQVSILSKDGDFPVRPCNGCEHLDSVLFTGDSTTVPGIFQLKGNAVCGAFVPSAITPGASEAIYVTCIASAFDGKVYLVYNRPADSTYHVDYLGTNRQNNAIMRTLWHRRGTDKLKRWGGVKLNLKSLPASTSVKVEYRTDRKAAFTDPSISISSSNQDKPAIFAAQPRSREIQFRFTYTTSTTNTPELLSYDPLFAVLNTVRA